MASILRKNLMGIYYHSRRNMRSRLLLLGIHILCILSKVEYILLCCAFKLDHSFRTLSFSLLDRDITSLPLLKWRGCWMRRSYRIHLYELHVKWGTPLNRTTPSSSTDSGCQCGEIIHTKK